jgi:hypothetical protein
VPGGLAAMPIAAQSCEPAYGSHSVPFYADVGDLDCGYCFIRGIYGIQAADPFNDQHGIDDDNYANGSYGCEEKLPPISPQH